MKTPTPVTSSSEDIDRFNRPPRIQPPLPEREVALPAPPVPTKYKTIIACCLVYLIGQPSDSLRDRMFGFR